VHGGIDGQSAHRPITTSSSWSRNGFLGERTKSLFSNPCQLQTSTLEKSSQLLLVNELLMAAWPVSKMRISRKSRRREIVVGLIYSRISGNINESDEN
jgi:hypothetical protein